eukprot:m.20080 g.20080  ORF g.20080 m.20080 type:complete len:340 (+) comp27971_c0_seq1:37-1056(+)
MVSGIERDKRSNRLALKSVYLVLWYGFSLGTLFLNKYILSWQGGQPAHVGSFQMIVTTICGGVQLASANLWTSIRRRNQKKFNGGLQQRNWKSFCRKMSFLGAMRFTTVVLGLISLKSVAVSFTETVKASAPMFTVVVARLMIGEKTGLFVNLSLFPIMAGLAICSATELSFNLLGFGAAFFNNIVDCIQNVFSKKLLSNDKEPYSPVELQFYASAASLVLQLPYWIFYLEFPNQPLSKFLIGLLLIDGLLFHLQSLTAYALMSLISPVTHSVANTVKRALLIWLSILVFGNSVTSLSAVGTALVICGVFFYNKARQSERRDQHRVIQLMPDEVVVDSN